MLVSFVEGVWGPWSCPRASVSRMAGSLVEHWLVSPVWIAGPVSTVSFPWSRAAGGVGFRKAGLGFGVGWAHCWVLRKRAGLHMGPLRLRRSCV